MEITNLTEYLSKVKPLSNQTSYNLVLYLAANARGGMYRVIKHEFLHPNVLWEGSPEIIKIIVKYGPIDKMIKDIQSYRVAVRKTPIDKRRRFSLRTPH
jgi:hypothetical protein